MVDEFKYKEAINFYLKAWDLLPQPKTDWEASTWIKTALGDAVYFKNDYGISKGYFLDALNCPGGIGNPFIMLRLGQCLYEMGESQKARDYLLKAYMLEGYEVFIDEDVKYFNLIKNS